MIRTTIAACLLLCLPRYAKADYPVVDAVQGLPNPTLVTVYPDDKNPHLYYFVPTRLKIDSEPDGHMRFGVQYWGLTGLDPAGTGGAFTVTVLPDWNSALLDQVRAAIIKNDPQATFAVPNLLRSKMEIILNKSYMAQNQDTTAPVSTVGNTVDATQAFSIGVNSVGARAFAQGEAKESDVVAARYTYAFRGIGKRLHASVTVYDKRVYDHFQATVTTSSWWGAVKTNWKADWEKLVKDGVIKVAILQGGVSDDDEYILTVFKTLVEAKIAGEGMFKPELQPTSIDTNTGSGIAGWGFSSSVAWQHLDEQSNYTFEIDKQALEEREFSLGVSFSAVCAKYPNNFVDLTSGGHCVDLSKFSQIVKLQAACVKVKTDRIDDLLDRKLIDQVVWERQRTAAENAPCVSSAFDVVASPMLIEGLGSKPVVGKTAADSPRRLQLKESKEKP